MSYRNIALLGRAGHTDIKTESVPFIRDVQMAKDHGRARSKITHALQYFYVVDLPSMFKRDLVCKSYKILADDQQCQCSCSVVYEPLQDYY